MKIEISRCLDLWYKSKNNTYPVCIRLYHNRKYDYIATQVSLSQSEYHNLHSPKVKTALKEVLKKVIEVENAVKEFLGGNNPFDIKLIRSYVEGKDKSIAIPSKKNLLSLNLFDWFELKIELCRKNKQFGNAESYTSTRNVFKDLFETSVLPFNFFSVERLRDIETSMIEKRKVEISTVGKHARNLRAIFKMAINEGVITMSDYPFGRYKYIIPEVTKAKKSLSRKMMADLVRYVPTTYYEKRALSYFIFSYFGNGMNLKDIALLKYKDWKDDVLYYYRKKTKNTTSKLKVIRVIVTEEMRLVISEFGNPLKTPDDYIFPIVEMGMPEERVNTRVHTRSKSINNTLGRICKKLNFDKKVTLGMARHSFANALKQEGISVSFIQEALGHGSASTTEHYMNSFEDAISTKYIQKLKSYFRKLEE